MAFTEGVINKCLIGKLETHNVETVVKLSSLKEKCAWEAEAQNRSERRDALEESTRLNKLEIEGRRKPPPSPQSDAQKHGDNRRKERTSP